ncbi:MULTISPECIES: TetR/AcrR family transcriptional regulator [Nocardiaceae]|uniref:Putative HTH-type transcriptional regulator n=1 Tax=Rhodococcoides fascians TaxID=1828 RepID=A0A143QHG9_RHOFA|nr:MULTISPECIES: TetR/AcrR family transcriptional regulator [Rhodococcus]AMY22371.1 putative HTH-type transcriptional regulator [Rhodococcus fascians]KMJ51696.1 TetR family transcriptional regulator [Rhodococcus fascians]MBX5331685.1 TetR/AcrR family transcriptional regulator [Rhodococcus fascians]MBY4058842.1 TetR/AcrR family transcriptional regulator [Rhodococcus fascians]MBY4067694.1 TetR/AcrR family transcriptional regulator [Rhodococcus fascians]
MSPRKATGAAVFQPDVTRAITEAVLDEFAELGFGRLSMEGVAKRAGVGKSALYRRWPSKVDMVVSVLSEFSVDISRIPDTGSLYGDLRATLDNLMEWIGDPRFARIFPDLVAESARTPRLAQLHMELIGIPRRERAIRVFERAIDRGEMAAGFDLELALDLLAGTVYWRFAVRGVAVDSAYLDEVATALIGAFSNA